MPVKKPKLNTTGAVGGYLRVSRINYPPKCQTQEARFAFIDVMRQIRKAELSRDAARQGETITQWYDDMV